MAQRSDVDAEVTQIVSPKFKVVKLMIRLLFSYSVLSEVINVSQKSQSVLKEAFVLLDETKRVCE